VRKIALLAAAVLVLVSCSEPPGPSALDDEASPPATEISPGATKTDDGKAGKDAKKKSATPDGGSGDDGAAGDDATGDDAYTEGAAEDDHSSALFPAAGDYVYAQSGYERFCDAATCERQSLPDRQTVEVTVKDRARDRAVVVAQAQTSGNRMMRTTTTFTPGVAAVTNVYARFSYQGFTFENSYQPDPPVESLRFPLSEGRSWSGRWRDSTSGTYGFDVVGREQVEVRGAAVQAFKIDYEMTFTGEFEGTSNGTVWVDPATRVVVSATGRLDLRSAFGRYTTEGTTQLVSGPDYR